MKKLIWILGLLGVSSSTFAQGIARDWFGLLNVAAGQSLHLVFHIVKDGDTYTTTLDSPDQGASGLLTDQTTVSGNQILIKSARYGITYKGSYLPDSSRIRGTFKQGAGEFPLTLTAAKSKAIVERPVVRPQDPKDFPYKQEEVAFTNPKAGDRLAGTLTLPADGKATKIVILITGSGPQNRNEELLNHRPFLVWSDWLTRHGIAVLRYDDRGTAQSTGQFKGATSADFADDAEAAVAYIRSRPDLNKLSIGLMGHSEGGLIAPMVASRNPAVKFVVLLAGPGIPIIDLMVKQSADQMRLSGAPEAAIRLASITNRKLYNLIAQNPGLPPAALQARADTLLAHDLRSYPPAALGGQSVDAIIAGTNSTITSPWFRYFIGFDPGAYLKKLHCPVLALGGTKDMQVNAQANLAGIRASLTKGGNQHFETVPLDGLNHLFQKANTGAVGEYSKIEETVDPVALEKVSAWITKL